MEIFVLCVLPQVFISIFSLTRHLERRSILFPDSQHLHQEMGRTQILNSTHSLSFHLIVLSPNQKNKSLWHWRCMKVYESLWKFMRVYESLWEFMRVYNESLWEFMRVYFNGYSMVFVAVSVRLNHIYSKIQGFRIRFLGRLMILVMLLEKAKYTRLSAPWQNEAVEAIDVIRLCCPSAIVKFCDSSKRHVC